MRRPRVVIAQENTPWVMANAEVTFEEVSRIPRLEEALSRRRKPAVAVVALDFPGLGGPAGLRALRQLSPSTKFIAVAREGDEVEEVEALRSGAKGYVTKALPDSMFHKAIEKVREGEIWAGRRAIGALLDELVGAPAVAGGIGTQKIRTSQRDYLKQLERLTPRELDIVRGLANGATNKEIAANLNVSVSTVKAHLTHIFRKLDQPDRLRLALYLTQAARDDLSADDVPPAVK